MNKCPVCGSDGTDLVFVFECTNKKCSNYKEKEKEELEEFDFGEDSDWYDFFN